MQLTFLHILYINQLDVKKLQMTFLNIFFVANLLL